MEAIAKQNIGFSEDRKMWKKDLGAAIKDLGHDEVLTAFYEWSSTNSNFVGKKPISYFLSKVDEHVSLVVRPKPTVTNPVLDYTEKEIAYITSGRVFFTGDFRYRLALLLKSYGKELVLESFRGFFSTREDKDIPYTAKNFLERAEILISTAQRVHREADAQQKLADLQYEQAKAQVVPDEEEPDEL